MAGIINYFHGESGLVTGHQYIADQEERVLRLRDDPHRELAYAYGGDIHIDPLLKPGDRTVYIRVDPWGGVWVRECDQYYPELQQAIDRVVEERQQALHRIIEEQRAGRAEQHATGETEGRTSRRPSEQPATEASFFLSFSSKNVLLARQIFEDLKRDAKVEVWFDLDQEGESPEHVPRIETWLREAVFANRGFVLLWTKAAKESLWVRREISWASEKASRERDFHFVVLKLDEEPVPTDLLDTRYVVDCYDLGPTNGINEELFAAVSGRQGRAAWVEEHRRRGVEVPWEKDEGSDGYEPFRSDSGIAVSLRHWEEGGDLHWQLDYEKDRRLHKTFGCGEEQAVDLGIRCGDYVGFFICHRSPLGIRFLPGVPLWMRSRDLSIRPEDVLVAYRQRNGATGSTGAHV